MGRRVRRSSSKIFALLAGVIYSRLLSYIAMSLSNISFASLDEALDQKPEAEIIVGSGKGGVGKTTTNSGVLYLLNRTGVPTFGYDLDGSPSLEFNTAAVRPEGMDGGHINPVAVSTMEDAEVLVAQSSRIIPSLHDDVLAEVQEALAPLKQ